MSEEGGLAVFGAGEPAEGVVVGDGGVEFLVALFGEELAFALMPLEVVLGEEDPVGEAEMEAAGGAVEGGVIACEAGGGGLSVDVSANGSVASRGAEAEAFDAEGIEEFFLDRFFPGGAGEFFDDGSGDDVAPVGVEESFAGLFFEGDFGDGEARFESVGTLGIGRESGGVAEELGDGDCGGIGVEVFGLSGENLGEGGVPVDEFLFNKAGHEGGGHRFAIGADVPGGVICGLRFSVGTGGSDDGEVEGVGFVKGDAGHGRDFALVEGFEHFFFCFPGGGVKGDNEGKSGEEFHGGSWGVFGFQVRLRGLEDVAVHAAMRVSFSFRVRDLMRSSSLVAWERVPISWR